MTLLHLRRTTTFRTIASTWCVLIFAWSGALQNVRAQPGSTEPQVTVKVAAEQIFLGESVLYRVTLNHIKDPSMPKFVGFDDFDVEFKDQRSLNSRSIQIINGVRSETVRYGQAYDFLLTPKKTGTLTIPPPVALVKGKELRGQARRLEVRRPEDQDSVYLETKISPDRVFPTQTFNVTLTVAVKGLPAPHEQRNPLSVRSTSPVLQIPWATDDSIAEGLSPVKPWQRWLTPQQSRQAGGFIINNIGTAPNSLFRVFENRSARFMPKFRQIRRTDKRGRSVPYWEYTFNRQFKASSPGTYSFGPTSLTGTFVSRAGERLEGERIFASSPKVEALVKDVPLDGRPAYYVGVVGRMHVQANITPDTAKVGDPMTLTIVFSGSASFDSVTAPHLRGQEEVVNRFRVYDATSQPLRQGRSFSIALRALRADVAELPAIPVAYFDPSAEKFVTLHTDPIPLQISEASRFSDGDIEIAPSSARATNDLELHDGGTFPNDTDPSALQDQQVQPTRWLLGLLSLAAFYGVAVVTTNQVRRYKDDALGQSRRRAPQVARGKLEAASHELKQGRAREAADAISAALIGFVADLCGQDRAGLTSADAHRLLSTLCMDRQILDRFGGLLESCDTARYGAKEDSLRGIESDAAALLDDLISRLQGKK